MLTRISHKGAHPKGPGRSPAGQKRWHLAAAAVLFGAIAMTLASCSPGAAPQKVQAAPVSRPTTTSADQAPPAAPAAPSSSGVTLVAAQNDEVAVPLAALSDGQARFYALKSGSKTITFFVVQGSDQVVRGAVDACDVCFPAKKGYHQEGDVMICNNCGNRFPITRINVERGGCNPVPLSVVVNGDQVIVPLGELEAGARYF